MDQKVTVGLGPLGVMVQITENDVTASAYLDIDEAYAHVGHVNAAALTLEQSAYVQKMQEQQENARVMAQINKGKGKLWTPER